MALAASWTLSHLSEGPQRALFMLRVPCAPGKPKWGLLVLSAAAILSAPVSQRWGCVRPPKAVPVFCVSAGFGWCLDPSADPSWGFLQQLGPVSPAQLSNSLSVSRAPGPCNAIVTSTGHRAGPS